MAQPRSIQSDSEARRGEVTPPSSQTQRSQRAACNATRASYGYMLSEEEDVESSNRHTTEYEMTYRHPQYHSILT
ncbi:hypothetical protein V6N13_021832 [Hibiscus sabdariffa]|uniref:Uncharacterized protein n=1 Tax=Hibiscus sabdariffa TaxID=183260 RepID=A0ABR2CPT8_9ROSI